MPSRHRLAYGIGVCRALLGKSVVLTASPGLCPAAREATGPFGSGCGASEESGFPGQRAALPGHRACTVRVREGLGRAEGRLSGGLGLLFCLGPASFCLLLVKIVSLHLVYSSSEERPQVDGCYSVALARHTRASLALRSLSWLSSSRVTATQHGHGGVAGGAVRTGATPGHRARRSHRAGCSMHCTLARGRLYLPLSPQTSHGS